MDNRYLQKELSWNAFNSRVAELALDRTLPLLDRLKFMSIVSSNYDEFFMVRVAGLIGNSAAGNAPLPPTNQRPSDILDQLLGETRTLAKQLDREMTECIIPELAKNGLAIVSPASWTPEQEHVARTVFEQELSPIVTPRAVTQQSGSETLMEQLVQGHIHAAFALDNTTLGFVNLPASLNRFCYIPAGKPGSNHSIQVLLLEDILLTFGGDLFPGQSMESCCLFRITRSADRAVDEEQDENFMDAMNEILLERNKSAPVRLETQGNPGLARRICRDMTMNPMHHFQYKGPLNHRDFFRLAQSPEMGNLPELRTQHTDPPPPQPASELPESTDLWQTLQNTDILLHHPYETYNPVLRMVDEAAESPQTLAIKMTLYRTSGTSPIVASLLKAARRGIQVTVLVEVKARFDEGANINWARQLRDAGAIVVYGLALLKVHAKMLMVVRREPGGIQRYVHLGTGNYNEQTARQYTDMGLMTTREELTRDTMLVFNAITGYSSEPHLGTLHMAPFGLRRETLRLIEREEKRARDGEEARITAKMNALIDKDIIDALYSASSAGVRIDLNIRGMCSLKPGIPGLSENITVTSIIDTYLEHTRAFAYHNGGNQEVYLSSADWMPRNLDRRVELLFPITTSTHKKRILTMLAACLRDNTQSWQLHSNGTWTRRTPAPHEKPYRAQASLSKEATLIAREHEKSERQALKVRREDISQ